MSLLLILLGCLAACSGNREEMYFDIPAGPAAQTLREFARQAKVEILFDLQKVSGLETRAVCGGYDPHDALRLMLDGTPMEYVAEAGTGAFAVSVKDTPPRKQLFR